MKKPRRDKEHMAIRRKNNFEDRYAKGIHFDIRSKGCCFITMETNAGSLGNGFLRINASSFTEVHQCPTCNSQGEVEAELMEQLINDGVVDDKIKIDKLKNLLKDVEKARIQ
jgi:hypothetical protein